MTTAATPHRVRTPGRRMVIMALRDTAERLRSLAPTAPAGTAWRLRGTADALADLAENGGRGKSLSGGRLFQPAATAIARAQMILVDAGPEAQTILRDAVIALEDAAAVMPPSASPYLVSVPLQGGFLDPATNPLPSTCGHAA